MKTKDLTNGLSDFQERVSETARNVGTATDRYVHENAWTSVAFAAFIGCVIGYLVGHRGGD